MAMIPKLELRQSQGLVMTPQLQQAIKLLQMSSFELQAFVDAELERNPLLEREESGEQQPPSSETESPQQKAAEASENFGRHGEESQQQFESTGGQRSEEKLVPGQSDSGWTSLGSRQGGSFSSTDDFDFDSSLSREATLQEHLTEQLNLTLDKPDDRLIGAYLIGTVDEAGYLTQELSDIAEGLGAPLAQAERVLNVLQGFDPPGVFARNLKECLELQLKEAGRLDPAMACFIENLELLARRNYAALQRLCGVSADDIKDMAAEVTRLNPKPGAAFGQLVVQAVIPDVSVKEAPDGSWLVELNSDTLPRVLVNKQYYATVSRTGAREQDKLYLSECLTTAQWLVKSLDQRARTILKVAQEIVRQQDGFLVHGVKAMRPLTLRTVAEAIGMHESTVSRVTSNKFMATPRGIFELKYFFTTAIGATAHGDDPHSAESVRHKIKEMIVREKQVLSDDVIVAVLKEAGIEIARRTVAKYRETMGIPSSVRRRREKQLRG
ncbi:MAG TPA: RNA polymerase factor sigma-54 [Aestuariivirgaceae bacterium]|nr:RNA polymerase factor sigma-54 [Aestuariivirgaceae bacterium]